MNVVKCKTCNRSIKKNGLRKHERGKYHIGMIEYNKSRNMLRKLSRYYIPLNSYYDNDFFGDKVKYMKSVTVTEKSGTVFHNGKSNYVLRSKWHIFRNMEIKAELAKRVAEFKEELKEVKEASLCDKKYRGKLTKLFKKHKIDLPFNIRDGMIREFKELHKFGLTILAYKLGVRQYYTVTVIDGNQEHTVNRNSLDDETLFGVEVAKAMKAGLDIKRQGDIYFIPVNKKFVKGIEKDADIAWTNHKAEYMVRRDRQSYVKGKITHTQNQHDELFLKTWHSAHSVGAD